ncbi:hypothetical protein [Streptomyces sp. G45]|uniref:hypothetical protein n=1 Tax=Streptomyces sp. G45 TaxID=3406627 RepID=UPI003C217059
MEQVTAVALMAALSRAAALHASRDALYASRGALYEAVRAAAAPELADRVHAWCAAPDRRDPAATRAMARSLAQQAAE